MIYRIIILLATSTVLFGALANSKSYSNSIDFLKPFTRQNKNNNINQYIADQGHYNNYFTCDNQDTLTVSDIINTIEFQSNNILSSLNIKRPRNTNDMIEIGFEESDLKSNGIHPSGNPPQLSTIPEYIFQGKQSLRICLDKYNSPTEYRTEFILNPAVYDNKFIELEYGKEYWIGFVIVLDNSYKIPRLGDIVFQVHGKPDLILGEGYRNPAFSLSVSGDLDNKKLNVTKSHWTIAVNGDDRKITPSKGNRYPTKVLAAVSPVKPDIGYWVSWVLHFKHTYKPDGFIEAWKNGKKVFYQDQIRTTFNDSRGSYIKIGSYKWSWRDKHNYPVIDPAIRISYLDALRIAQGADRYNDVAPEQNGPSSAWQNDK